MIIDRVASGDEKGFLADVRAYLILMCAQGLF